MNHETVINLLNDVRDKKVSVENAFECFRDMPFKDLDFVKLDYHRDIRTGIGEVIYCKNKKLSQLESSILLVSVTFNPPHCNVLVPH